MMKIKVLQKLCFPKYYVPFLGLIVVVFLPILVRNPFWTHLLIMVFFFATLTYAWNIISGYGGQVSFGNAAFFGIGAYSSTILYLSLGLSPWLGMFAGGFLAIALGIIIGYPCFRLRGIFFSLTTFAIAEVLRILCVHWRGVTRGGLGMLIHFKSGFSNFMFEDKMAYAYIALSFMVAVILVTYFIENSRFGYYLKAIKENEDAAQSLGVNTTNWKLIAMAINAFFTACVGTFYSQYLLYIDPEIAFSWTISLDAMLPSVVGGVSTIGGPLIGAVILTPLDVLLRGWFGGVYAGLSFLMYGCILLAVVMLLPEGIIKWVGPWYNKLLAIFPEIPLSQWNIFPEGIEKRHPSIPSLTKDQPILTDKGNILFETKNLTKRFGGLIAVNQLSLNVKNGEIVALIGPNGAGKTTFFNLVTGFLRPDSGTTVFRGRSINFFKTCKLSQDGIARTFQLVKPFPKMTVVENIMVGAFSKSKDVGSAQLKASEIIHFTGLSKYQEVLAEKLTIVDRKRLELARALATEPVFLLLDEVMGGLNPTETEDMIKLIKEINRKGIAILIIEHVIKAIMAISDRIIVIHHGRKIAEGRPAEIVHNQEVIKAYLGEDYVA
jgi:branched-chain amino acid transport system permease protein